jgi:hypothetical protein
MRVPSANFVAWPSTSECSRARTEQFEAFAAELREIQRRRSEKSGKVERTLHVKAHTCLVGELTITASDPRRSGVFSGELASFPIYARFSSGSSRRQPDSVPDVRGFAIKLVGVSGPKLIPGLESAKTQDFLFIGEPAIAFRDPNEFVTFVRAAKGRSAHAAPAHLLGLRLQARLPDRAPSARNAEDLVVRSAPILHGRPDCLRHHGGKARTLPPLTRRASRDQRRACPPR